LSSTPVRSSPCRAWEEDEDWRREETLDSLASSVKQTVLLMGYLEIFQYVDFV